MHVFVDESLNAQLVETEAFLKDLRDGQSRDRNDAKMFLPTLNALDKLAVAITAVRAPAESFLKATDMKRPCFDINSPSVAEALENAIAYLRDPATLNVMRDKLSPYTLEVTEVAVKLLKSLYFCTLDGVRHTAERDLRKLHGGSVEAFLSSAEVIRTWAVEGA